MRLELIHNWRTELHRVWCIRASLSLGVFMGVASVISCFDEVFNPWFLLAVAIFVNLAIIPLTRLVDQQKTGLSE